MTDPLLDPLALTRLVAGAILAAHGQVAAVPYPAAAQLALDRLTAACLSNGENGPPSVPALLALGRIPLTDWPIDLPSDYADPQAVLINEAGLPTGLCVDWATGPLVTGASTPADVLLSGLAGNCPSAATYERCRDFLVDHPVLSQDSVLALLAAPGGSMTWNRLQHLYEEVSSVYAIEGQVGLCECCGCLVLPLRDGRAGDCESGICPSTVLPRTAPVSTLQALPLNVRSSIAASGRVERVIRSACEAAGAQVSANRDTVDHLRVGWSSGDVWLVTAAVATEPALLARRLGHWTPSGAARVCVAVPEVIVNRRNDYRQIFDRHRSPNSAELVIAEQEANLAAAHSFRGGSDA